MAYLNDHYLKLKAGYLFPEIARRVRQFGDEKPDLAKNIIRCGIGDVTEPLPPSAIEAMHRAVEELAHRESFRSSMALIIPAHFWPAPMGFPPPPIAGRTIRSASAPGLR